MLRKFLVTFAAAGLLVGGMAQSAEAADPGAESQFLSLTNSLRASKGLPALSTNSTLVAKARNWSASQAAAGGISHSNLASGAPSNWIRLGENVGKGPSVQSIHNALVASPGHYANLVDPGFQYVGMGVVNSNGTLYVTQVFMETASQPTPEPPPPAAETPPPAPAPAPQPASAPAPAPEPEPEPAPAPAVPTPPPPPPPPTAADALDEPSPSMEPVLSAVRTFESG